MAEGCSCCFSLTAECQMGLWPLQVPASQGTCYVLCWATVASCQMMMSLSACPGDSASNTSQLSLSGHTLIQCRLCNRLSGIGWEGSTLSLDLAVLSVSNKSDTASHHSGGHDEAARSCHHCLPHEPSPT